ncbi:MAG: histidinol-phosphate transaminase [Mariprofundaceae bacterium]
MLRKDIRSLTAYTVPDSTGMIKLDAMENPYTLPESLQALLADRLKSVALNRYPDADMHTLRYRIAEKEGLKPSQVLLGNGSDEIIQMLLMAVDDGAMVSPNPSFIMYELVSKWLRRPIAVMPLNADFSLDAKKILQLCRREKAAIIFLACPNNPTGNLWPESTIREIIDNFNGLVVIDEAYLPFAGHTHTHLIAPNVVVLRTFSKLGWAGLRLGYLLGEEEVVTQLNKVRMPYNIDALTQAAAAVLLDHSELFVQQAERVCRERDRVEAVLSELEGIKLFPSQANFILIRVADANLVFESLKERHILIKNMHAKGSVLANCLRITIGTGDENDLLLSALKEIMK